MLHVTHQCDWVVIVNAAYVKHSGVLRLSLLYPNTHS